MGHYREFYLKISFSTLYIKIVFFKASKEGSSDEPGEENSHVYIGHGRRYALTSKLNYKFHIY